MVDNAPSVGILRFSKNPVGARDKKFQQRVESFSLAGTLGARYTVEIRPLSDILNPSIYQICELIKMATRWHI